MADYRVMGIIEATPRAERVIEDLAAAQFAHEDISILYLSPRELAEESDQSDVLKGAAAGSATGGTLGALAGLASFAIPGVGPVIGAGILGSATAGAAAGGVLGAWSQIGLEDDLAATYQESLEKGETIIAIDTPNPDRAADAEHILRDHDCSMVNTFQV